MAMLNFRGVNVHVVGRAKGIHLGHVYWQSRSAISKLARAVSSIGESPAVFRSFARCIGKPCRLSGYISKNCYSKMNTLQHTTTILFTNCVKEIAIELDMYSRNV